MEKADIRFARVKRALSLIVEAPMPVTASLMRLEDVLTVFLTGVMAAYAPPHFCLIHFIDLYLLYYKYE